VAAHLARHKRFPEGAQSKRNEGTAVVRFSLDGGGRVITVKLITSSGVAALDQEAQAMVRRASPFPAPPSGGTMEFTVPLSFQIH
jgi:TonB family protein